MAPLLNEDNHNRVREVFKEMQSPVDVVLFSSTANCEYCESTQQLLEEVTGLSEKIQLEVHDLDADRDLAASYGIDKAPGFAIVAKPADTPVDFGIRFYGIPSGHEFTTLVNDLVMVSAQSSGLNPETVSSLQEIKTPVHLQVFITPT